MTSRIELIRLDETCSSSPSQWEGKTKEGKDFYARYRYGRLTWGFGDNISEAVDDSMRGENAVVLGSEYDGHLSVDKMLDHIGLVVVSDGI